MTMDKKNALKIFYILILVLIAKLDASTPIRKCNNDQPMPLMVQIDNCDTLPCNFWKGSKSNMAIQFVATKNSMNQLRADVRLTTLGVEIPYELEQDHENVCKHLMYEAYCPLDIGEDVTYNLVMQISEQQLEVPIKIEVNIVDSSDDSVISCFMTDGRVKKNTGTN